MARLTRKQLAEVFPNHELIKAFEQIDEATDATLPTQIAQAQLTADTALNLATGEALGVFDRRDRVLSLRQGDGVVVTQDAAGYVFSLDLGFVVNAAKAFLSHTFQVTAEAIRYALGYTPAPTNSPAFTGIPTAPTAAAGTNTTQIATTAHVFAERTNAATLTNKSIDLASNTLTATSAQLAAALTDETGTGAAVFAGSPALTGVPTAPTAAADTNTTQIATTAFVQQELTPEAFIAPTLLNSWVNFGAGFNNAGYFKDPFGIVHLRGLIKDGTAAAGTAFFTLPAGYRPAATEILTSSSNNAYAQCRVSTAGNVAFEVGSNVWFSLDGITFRAA